MSVTDIKSKQRIGDRSNYISFEEFDSSYILDLSSLKQTQIKHEIWDAIIYQKEHRFKHISKKSLTANVLAKVKKIIYYLSIHDNFSSILDIDKQSALEIFQLNSRVLLEFNKLVETLLIIQPFDKKADIWDVQKLLPHVKLFEKVSSSRFLNFNIIQHDSIKSELKNYFEAKITYFEKLQPGAFIDVHLYPFQSLMRALSVHNKVAHLPDFTEEEYETFLKSEGKQNTKLHLENFRRVKIGVISKVHLPFFERDLWNIGDLSISDIRKNHADFRDLMYFYDLDNTANKNVLKDSLKYLLLSTQLSLSTIFADYDYLKKLFKNIEDIDIKKLELEQKEYILSFFTDSIDSRDKALGSFKRFLNYLHREKYISLDTLENFILKRDFSGKEVSKNFRMVETNISSQLIQLIEHHGAKYMYLKPVMYLIVFCGLRITDAVSIKLSSLYTANTGTRRLRYFSQKMKKNCEVPITEEVFEVLEKQQKQTHALKGENTTYLFPSFKSSQSTYTVNKPISTTRINLHMQNLIESYGIKTSKGEQYKFRAHDFRHSYATYLHQNGIRIETISELLGHETTEMTKLYIDEINQLERAAIKIQVDASSKDIYPDMDVEVMTDTANIDAIHLKKNIQYQSLANGTCTLPALQSCPHPNKCFSCKSFVTTKQYLSVFQKQLERTERMIEFSKDKGFKRQLETNIILKEKIEYFIKEIQNGKDFVRAISE
jgi:integrase